MTVTWYRRYFEAPQSRAAMVRDQLDWPTRAASRTQAAS